MTPGALATGVLVLGVGNPLRSDDGVGPAVAARLAADPRMAGADVRAVHQLTPELAVDAAGSALLVVVDAAADQAPGDVDSRWLDAPEPTEDAWTHRLDPAALVALAHELEGHAPPVLLVGVGPATLEVGEGLSAEASAAIGPAAEVVVAAVAAARGEGAAVDARDA